MIPFIDLAAQQKIIRGQVQRRIEAVLSHGQYVMGPEVLELEKDLVEFTGAKHVISCSSGTDALLMPLMAYGIGPGDAVFTTPFTFISTAEVISLLGATPVFVDVDPGTFNLDPVKLEPAVKAVLEQDPGIHPIPKHFSGQRSAVGRQLSPKGIIAVDLFGLPADYDAIEGFAKEHGLFVLEDAAQSFGATYKGKKVGTLGHVSATSFFPAKPLGCYGDGGAVMTDDDGLAEIMESIRNHGKGKEKYDNVRIGINGRLDTMQAAILLEKLKIFPEEIDARNRVAEQYSERLKEIVRVPRVPQGYTSVWAQYSILPDNRENIQNKLKEAEIPTAIYYPRPLHLQGAFKDLGYEEGDFPVSEELSKKIVSLPMHPYLDDKTVEKITDVIKGAPA